VRWLILKVLLLQRLMLVQRLVLLLQILQWQWLRLLLLLILLWVLHLVLQRLVLVLWLLWERRIFACIPHAVALIRTLFLVDIPLEIGCSEQALDGVTIADGG